jgi:hypothetical protein
MKPFKFYLIEEVEVKSGKKTLTAPLKPFCRIFLQFDVFHSRKHFNPTLLLIYIFLGRMLKGPAILPCFVFLAAVAKILPEKMGTSTSSACLPCLPACFVLVKQFVPTTSTLVEVNVCVN